MFQQTAGQLGAVESPCLSSKYPTVIYFGVQLWDMYCKTKLTVVVSGIGGFRPKFYVTWLLVTRL